jgi:hypothetical protein
MGGFRQRSATSAQKGCQIGYLIQTATKNLFVCEFKFRRCELDREVISEMQEKNLALKIPRGFTRVPVLFHPSGVSNTVAIFSYFYRTVDIINFLDGH